MLNIFKAPQCPHTIYHNRGRQLTDTDRKNPNIILISLIYLIPVLYILFRWLSLLEGRPEYTHTLSIILFELLALLALLILILALIGSICYQIQEKPKDPVFLLLFDIAILILFLVIILSTRNYELTPINLAKNSMGILPSLLLLLSPCIGLVVFGIREADIRARRLSLGFIITGLVFIVYCIAASIGGSDVAPFSPPPLYSPALMMIFYLTWTVLGVAAMVFLIKSAMTPARKKHMKRVLLALVIIGILFTAFCMFLSAYETEKEANLQTCILPMSVFAGEVREDQMTGSFPASSILVPYMILEGDSGKYDIFVAKTLGPDDPVMILKMDPAEYAELISHTPPDRVMVPFKNIYVNNENLSQTLERLVPGYTAYTGDEELAINILFPTEGGEASYGDVVPPWGVIRAFISSQNEIADVFVRSDSYGDEKITPLDPYPCVVGEYPTTPGNTSITLVVTDVFGNTAEKMVNFTVVRVVPEPPKP